MNRALRVTLFVIGAGCAGYGVALALPIVFSSAGFSFAGWFLGGPIAHDALLAPAAGVLGLALARVLPTTWRAPVLAAAACSAVLLVVAIGQLWRASVGTANPGLHDRDYRTGLLIWLAGIWVTAAIAGLVNWLRGRAAGRAARR